MNGRDITYNIVPDATFKFYITASIFERSKRRYKELKKLKKKVAFKDIVKSLKKGIDQIKTGQKNKVGLKKLKIHC